VFKHSLQNHQVSYEDFSFVYCFTPVASSSMPINLFMTWDRILLMFMGVCVVFLVFGHDFWNDLNIVDADKFATPPVAAKPANPNRPANAAINGEFQHVHWFVQVWYTVRY
jgi:hypothetical protein